MESSEAQSASPNIPAEQETAPLTPQRGNSHEPWPAEQHLWADQWLRETYLNYPISDWEPLKVEAKVKIIQVDKVSEYSPLRGLHHSNQERIGIKKGCGEPKNDRTRCHTRPNYEAKNVSFIKDQG